jgi:hypothetical protein
MPTLTHNKDAAQEQKHQATAEALKDKSTGHDKLNRGAAEQLERARETAMWAREMVQGAQKAAVDLIKEFNEPLDRTAPRFQAVMDTVEPAGPGGAAQSLRDEHSRSQREALEQSQSNEWGRHFDQIRESREAAAQSVAFAAESMLARHEATESTLRNDLVAKKDAARNRDQPAGSMTASDVLARQQQREEVVAGELETLARRQLDDAGRLLSLVSDMREAIRSFTQDAQANVTESAGRSNEQQLQDSQERLRRFNQQRRDIVALRMVWDGRLSDVEPMKRTWDKAAAGPAAELERKWDQLDERGRREAAAKAYETAREKFWGLVNKPADDAAREVHRLLDRVGAQWQKEKNAPLLDGITITLDHVADKAAHPKLALDASNLRFLTTDDNSARGNNFGVTDRRNVDFVSSEEQQLRNAKSRDRAASKRFDKGHATYDVLVVAKAEQRLKQEQERVAAQHHKESGEAVENRDKKADELRTSNLRLMNGEDENLRRARQNTRLDDLNKFLNAALKQSGQLQQFEQSMHERQQQELSQEQQRLAGGPAMTAEQILEEIRMLQLRFAEEQSKFENIWRDMDILRNLDELRMLRAIYEAASRQAQEESIKRALERQQQTQQDQDRRLRELARERDAHE